MTNRLASTINQLTAPDKGILAADESIVTMTKRFQAVNIASTEQSRCAYRELLLTTPHLNQYIAGVILCDETFNQLTSQSLRFPTLLDQQNILPGIKVDEGLMKLPYTQDEKVACGLDHLPERLALYAEQGARFAKWRAIYKITPVTPSPLSIYANAESLARYAAYCQEADLVPIVEPEVLIEGDHTIDQCERVMLDVLQAVFHALYRYRIKLEYTILKSSMVLAGQQCAHQASSKEVSIATVRVLKQVVPCSVSSIHFLSGGQTPQQATAHLSMIKQLGYLPWNVSYSYARALQEECLKVWQGPLLQKQPAQQVFYNRLKLVGLAMAGQYTSRMEENNITA